ncbi:uncharacterized protein LOC116653514 [Coturnix japonica]|uniref:uncharacterized protein LOC116653514 n=1 Tax=Coturnix japonica TaxID=93934 RepID=UPI0013A5F192|nr:uncharacterized protein LOC116653514 [Coturnix japonica]
MQPHTPGCPRVSRQLTATLGGPENRAQKHASRQHPTRREIPTAGSDPRQAPPGLLHTLRPNFPVQEQPPRRPEPRKLKSGWGLRGPQGPESGLALAGGCCGVTRCGQGDGQHQGGSAGGLTSCPSPTCIIPFRSHKFMLSHLVLELFWGISRHFPTVPPLDGLCCTRGSLASFPLPLAPQTSSGSSPGPALRSQTPEASSCVPGDGVAENDRIPRLKRIIVPTSARQKTLGVPIEQMQRVAHVR